MQQYSTWPSWPRMAMASVAAAVMLGACGGDGPAESPPPDNCSVAGQQTWLRQYMDDWYFWYADSPRPSASGYVDVASYFEAILFTGNPPTFPADRWSRSESTESFNRFFGDGATLGYGVSVAGLEITGLPHEPLYVRYVEALSPAALQGVRRGDQVMSVNGRSTSELVAADDFSALTANAKGDSLTLRLRRAGVERTVVVTADVFALTPVSGTSVVTSPQGRKLGYVVVKDMISQALAPMDAAFASFKAAGVHDVVLDLRYNGGGLVSTGATLASYVAGAQGDNRAYAWLRYSDKRSASDQRFAYSNPAAAVGLPRVIVLTGRRTCSASEQVINGLRGVGVQVLAVGDTTCGKPVGFLPTSACGQTYSVVNFESTNDRNEGRYFDGFDATCPVAEDFTADQGGASDPLMAVAAELADTGQCPSLARATPLQRRSTSRHLGGASDERQDMLAR
ncbi:MAG: PDZ domain-containing protein [Rubrivivax sp.]|nr:PDZ domain-containing protein [Rubrivivax sp.]